MIRYEKFYSKQSDQWRMEDEDCYHCREWDNLVECADGEYAISRSFVALPINMTDMDEDLYDFEWDNVFRALGMIGLGPNFGSPSCFAVVCDFSS